MTDHPKSNESYEDQSAAKHNSGVGLILFGLYLALYGGFIGLNTFAPSFMASTIAGVNYALIYGIGLIVAALALAGVYMALCRE